MQPLVQGIAKGAVKIAVEEKTPGRCHVPTLPKLIPTSPPLYQGQDERFLPDHTRSYPSLAAVIREFLLHLTQVLNTSTLSAQDRTGGAT